MNSNNQEEFKVRLDDLRNRYSDQLFKALPNSRRSFSLAFKKEATALMSEGPWTQKQFAELLGVALPVISKWKRMAGIKPQTSENRRENVSKSLFRSIDISESEGLRLEENSEIYLQGENGVKVYGLSFAQVRDLLRYL